MSEHATENNGFSRREFLHRTALGLAGAGALIYGGCGIKAQTSVRPNILLIVADDAGWRDVGYHGSEIMTPYIDQLRTTGVEMEQFYVCPTCSPTRASLLTGRPASRFGILGPIAGKSTQVLPLDTPTLPNLLKRKGYTTAITGKWHLGLRLENGPRQYGFDYTYGYLHGQIDPYTHLYKLGDNTWHRNEQFITEEGHATDLITNEAIQYIKDIRDKNKPFFLYVPFSVPHHPLNEDERWVAPYRDVITDDSRRLFAAAMSHLDYSIGRLLETLQQENLREDTLIIFMSDNGGQQAWIDNEDEYAGNYPAQKHLGDNQPLRDWKGSLYEGGIRVPAVWNWTSHLAARSVQSVACAADVLPTLASLTGLDLDGIEKMEGANVWNAISTGAHTPDRLLYWRTKEQLAVRRGDWKLVHTGKTPDQGQDELYNLKNDPHEKVDQSQHAHKKLAELRNLMKVQYALDGE